MTPADFDRELQNARFSMRVQKFPEALATYAQIAKRFPYSNLLYEYGGAAAASGDLDLADQLWQRIIKEDPNNMALCWRLVGDYAQLSLRLKSLALCEKAAALEPQNMPVQISLLSKLARSGSVENARVVLERVAALEPNNPWVRFFSGQLDRREGKFAEAEQKLRDILSAAPQDPKLVSACHMELARVLDRLQRFDEAMNSLEAAKKIAAQGMKVEAMKKSFEERSAKALALARSLPKNILDNWSKTFPPTVRSAAPPLAFLGGHMRSGTTLVEKIIDAHPSAVAYDESLASQTIAPLVDLTAAEIPAEKLNALRQRYLKNLVADTEKPPEGRTLLDKMPPATIDLPAMLRVFPELRVLIALRDPRDVLISSYFVRNTHIINLSLEAMAQNYNNVMNVWLAIRDWQGLNSLETRYEDVVADLEREGRRVTTFLGLEWQQEQARFYESNREKAVRNANEVSKPVYSEAVGRWQSYEKYLAPVLPTLEPFCKEFGYK